MHSLVVFAGNSNPQLAGNICRHIGIGLGDAEVKRFSDGEVQIEIRENVRGKDVFVLQSTCAPVNEHLVELLLMIDAFKRASARRITAVIVADLIEVAGANRVITMDLHAGQIQGFFNVPVDNLFAAPVLLQYIKNNFRNDTVVVSPDAGGAERARAFAKRLDSLMAIIDKRRDAPNKAEAMNVVGDVDGKIAIILDDMVDTAGTLTQAALALQERGASEVHACSAHAVLSGPAVERINESAIQSLVVTDTVPLGDKARECEKLRVLSVSKLLGEAIQRSHTGSSVSSLFV
jgi:ribose-phosphate pyrophosphokinase